MATPSKRRRSRRACSRRQARAPTAFASQPRRSGGRRAMTGNDYRDLIASYIHHNYASQGLVVYVEISLGKTVIGKDRYIDMFVVRPERSQSDRDRVQVPRLARHRRRKDSVRAARSRGAVGARLSRVRGQGLVEGRAALARGVAARGVVHARCDDARAQQDTRELDHMLAAMFGLWELVLPANKRFKPRPRPEPADAPHR